jgi:hypothetical protein
MMNYKDTFILVADDCPVEEGVVPAVKEGKSKPIHAIQYELIAKKPYKYTQEDVQFLVYAERNSIAKSDAEAREAFFKKSQPCLRSSALGKRYGWGVHFDSEGKAALVSKATSEYMKFESGNRANVKLIKAMRNKRVLS